MADPVNVALIGYGFAGRIFHAPLIEAARGLHLHTVVSGRPEAVHADLPGVRVVPDLEAALADPAIGLVVIATPNTTHAPLATLAIEAGRAVVVDKPFTVTLDEARGLIALAEARGVLLSVFHNRRWDSDFLTLKQLIADDALGPVRRLESHYDRFRPEVADRWRESEAPGAGRWFDLGPHLIDQALILFGRPEAVTADLAVLRPGGRAVDYAHVLLRYTDKRVVLHADMVSPAQDLRFVVQGARAGWIKHGLDTQEAQIQAGGRPGDPDFGLDPRPGERVEGDQRHTTVGPPGDYVAYYEGIAAALTEAGPNPVPPREALAVMEVLEAAILSDRERREVVLQGAES